MTCPNSRHLLLHRRDLAHVAGDGEDVELVVEEEAGLAGGQRQQEALVEARRHRALRLRAQAVMDVLWEGA